MQADKLHLAHRNATEDLAAIIGKADLYDERLDLAEASLLAHPRRIARHLPERFDIGGEPGKAVRRMLGVIEDGAIDLAARCERVAKASDGPGQEPVACRHCFGGEPDQSIEKHGLFRPDRLGCCHEMLLLLTSLAVCLPAAEQTAEKAAFGRFYRDRPRLCE